VADQRSGTVAVHEALPAGPPGRVLARVAVRWGGPDAVPPGMGTVPDTRQADRFERDTVTLGRVAYRGVTVRVGRQVRDGTEVGVRYDPGFRAVVAYDLRTGQPLAVREVAAEPRFLLRVGRDGMVRFGGDAPVPLPRGLPADYSGQVTAVPDFGSSTMQFLHPRGEAPPSEPLEMPAEWLLDPAGRRDSTVHEGGWVWVGPIRVSVGTRYAGRVVVLRGDPAGEVTVCERAGDGTEGPPLARVGVEWTAADADAMDVDQPLLPPAGAGSAAAPVPAQPPRLRPHQADWLADNRRRTGWVEQDRDSLAAAAVATNGPALVAEAMRLVADAAGMRQTLGTRPVTGRDLRMFLADLIESVVTAPRRDEGLFQDLRLSNFPIEAPPGGHRPSMAQMVAALRRLGEHPEVFDHWLPYLLHHFFEKARALSQDTLDVGFAWLFELPGLDVPADEVWLGPLDAEREVQQVVVQVGPYYLPTAPAGRPPHGRLAV